MQGVERNVSILATAFLIYKSMAVITRGITSTTRSKRNRHLRRGFMRIEREPLQLCGYKDRHCSYTVLDRKLDFTVMIDSDSYTVHA